MSYAQFVVGDSALQQLTTQVGDKDNGMLAVDAFIRDRLGEAGPEELRAARMQAMKNIEDALPAAQGWGLARMLEQILPQVLQEKYEPNNAMRLFPVSSVVREGFKTYTIRRKRTYGEWKYAGGNAKPPGGSLSLEEKTFRILPAVHAIRMNIYDIKSAAVMRMNLEAELREIAQRTSQDFLNDKAWNNSQPALSDVLNYPFIAQQIAAADFIDGTSADTILSILHAAANFQAGRTKRTYYPTRMILGTRAHDYLSTRYRNAFGDQSILEGFLKKNSYIKTVEIADELEGASTLVDGADVIMFDRPDSYQHVLVKGVTALPAQRDMYDIVIPMYLLHGGIRNDEPLNCLNLHVNFAHNL